MLSPIIQSQSCSVINGVTVYHELYNFDETNPKKTLVLIHGFLSSSFCYRKIIPLLQNEFTILNIDLPPFGKSDKSTLFTYSYENFAKIVITLIENYRLQDVMIIGHSMGGQIALYVSKLRNDLVKKQILLSSSCYMYKARPAVFYSSYLPFFSSFLKRYLSNRGILDNLLNVIHDKHLIDEEMMNGYSQPFYDRKIFKALTKMIRDREGDLPEEDIQQISTPTLLLWGDEDKIIPAKIGKRLHKQIKDSHFITFKDTGHLLPEERPQDIVQFIFQYH